MTERPPQPFRFRRLAAFGGTVLLLIGAAIWAAVYGIGPFQRNPAEAACRPAVELAQKIAPLARGEVAAMVVAERPMLVPNLEFHDEAGVERRLSEWRGRTVLLNLWATWCIPCRQEMPALDALQDKLGGEKFEVVAVNIDTRNLDKPRIWLKDNGVGWLSYYADPSAKVFQDLKIAGKATGMPTTMLVDPAGCELGTISGPAEWASADGVKLVSAALAR
jgi:thiol-disulfide isomerase/thioredoxin